MSKTVPVQTTFAPSGVRGTVLYTADAYRKDGKRFAVIADAKLTALLKLERATRYDGD